MKNFFKSEKGSMSAYVLITIISFIIILSTVFLISASVLKNQIKTLPKIKEAYEKDLEYKQEIYEEQVNLRKGPILTTPADASIEFSTAYGKIDIIWLAGQTNNVSQIPNAPELYSGTNALKPVTWTKSGDTWTEDTTAKSTWYNYTAVEGTGDSNDNNMWANAKNTDGSYFVWIPRYAYRITYYAEDPNTNTSQSPTGYYDGYGMWRASDRKIKYELEKDESGNEIVETVEHDDERYIVHPAFATNLDMGGWDSNLKGFWVAKYEMSMADGSGAHKETSNNTIGNVATGDTVKVVSKPGVSSWRYINIANCYNNSYNYDRTKESHLMKNSEWGAVAYLTESKYGRNGHEIDINNSSTFITGTGGAKASTTGNIYGIYDMSGGAWEYIAGFNKEYTGDYFSYNKPVNGNHFATTNGESTKYATAYSNNTGTIDGTIVYTVGKTGDGIKEVKGWHGDFTYVVHMGGPFPVRGGNYDNGVIAGVFASHYNSGYAYIGHSFRVVLGL